MLLGALATLVLEGSRRSILSSAEKLRDATARRVETQVRAQHGFLGKWMVCLAESDDSPWRYTATREQAPAFLP
ncbi:MAG: hypothetical protein E6J65_24750 [Deltaproteobacteria bacterium]|nr:MAG: hypothetical protein E6J65_24750 [Deltaproteobacteria bacterium]